MAARTDRPAPATEARSTVAHAGQLAQPAAMSNRVKASYAVKRGDTLASIARLYKTTVASIKTWNPRLPSDAAGRRPASDRLPPRQLISRA